MKFSIKMRKVTSQKAKDLPKKKLRKAHKDASQEYANEFRRRLNNAISRKDLSPEQLKEMDHPYAARHGRIRVFGTLKNFMVHERTGSFKSAFTIDNKGSNQNDQITNVRFNARKDHHNAVFYGTKRMIGRNPIAGVYYEMEKLKRPYRIYLKHIKKASK